MKPFWRWALMGGVAGLAWGSTFNLVLIIMTDVVPSVHWSRWLGLFVMAVGMGAIVGELMYVDHKQTQRGGLR